MKRIELPSNELALELQKYLQEKRFPEGTFDKGRREVQFSAGVKESEWSNIKAEAQKWAKGKNMEISEVIKFQLQTTVKAESKERSRTEPEGESRTDQKELEGEVKKRLASYTPEKAEERYNYLLSKPLSELSDLEWEERLALAAGPSKKPKDHKR